MGALGDRSGSPSMLTEPGVLVSPEPAHPTLSSSKNYLLSFPIGV
jgi:hypothetical protein